jgi:hypothetical protein
MIDSVSDRRTIATLFFVAGVFYWAVTAAGPASVLETDGALVPISLPENGNPVNNGYPALLRDRRGDLWCAFVSTRLRDPETRGPYEEGDQIVLRARRDGKWSEERLLNTNFGVNFAPALAQDASGGIVVVWSSRREGVDGIWWRRLPGAELRVPPAGRLEALPALATSADGRIFLAFQSYRQHSSDIVFYVLEGSGWQRLPDAAATSDPEFRPRLTAAPDGAIWCAWDVYCRGQYRVMVRRYDSRTHTWEAAEQAPGAGPLDAYAPDIAVDGRGRPWVAYARNEVEEHAWGLRGPRPGAAPRPTVRVVVRDASGWHSPGGFSATGDLPRISVDPAGTVWLVWQTLPGHVDWKVGAAVCPGKSWIGPQIFGAEEPVALDGPPRRADQRASIVADRPGHLVYAYERGRGAFRNRDIYLREVRLAGPALAAEPGLTPVPAGDTARPLRRASRRQPVLTTAGERLFLYFGDLHNHVLVDDGHQGSVDQLFAIHRDRFGSDFAATTSHGDSNKLLLSELAHNDLLTETMLDEPRFASIPGFEWTQGDFVTPRAGHRHVIYETPGGPLYRPTEGHSDSIREFADLMSRTNGLLFAHHISRASAGGTDWNHVNVRVEPAVEMCSSWGRFEYYQNPGHIRVKEMRGCSVRDAWRMGWRIGVIGGSDGHNLFGDRLQGLTGVYATALTRPELFEAIRSRRTYATTGEPIALDFRVNGRLMGSQITASEGPVVEAMVEGTAPLQAVEVIKYAAGAYETVYRAPLDGRRARVWWRDPDFRSNSFYYLRVTQEVTPDLAARYRDAKDNPFPSEMAWSSPVWVDQP